MTTLHADEIGKLGKFDQMAREHALMLAELKSQFQEKGEMYIGRLVHRIDPEWPNPWIEDGSWDDPLYNS